MEVAAVVALLGEFRIPLQAIRRPAEETWRKKKKVCVCGATWINWDTYGA